MMYDWHDGGWGPAAWIAMGFMMVAFWGLVAVLVVYLVGNRGHRPADQSGNASAPSDQAFRILNERFARGDIDANEYNERRDVLSSR